MATLEALRSRVDQAMGRVPVESDLRAVRLRQAGAPTLESLKARIQAVKGAPPISEPPGLGRSALHAVVQGAAGGIAGFPEQAGIQQQAEPRWVRDQFDKIDQGEVPSLGGLTGATTGRVVAYFNADPETRQRLRDEIETTIRPVADEPAYSLGQRIREGTAEAFPVNPEYESRFPVQLGRGLGSTATFLGTGLAGRLFRLPALAISGGTGALVNSSETFRDALGRGAPFEDAYKASRLAGVVGVSEAVPITRMLDRYDKASGGQLRRVLANAAKGGIEEGTQELFQTTAENLIASKIVAYDPERGLFQSAPEAGGVGFTVGALFNTLASMLGAKVRTTGSAQGQTVEQAPPTAEAPTTPPGTPQSPVAPPVVDEPVTVSPDFPGQPTAPAPPPDEGPVFPRDEPGAKPPKLSRRVPRSETALYNLLDEWDRLRNAPGVSPEHKAEAQRLQQDALNRLEDLKQQFFKARREGREVEGPIEFRLRTASGAETVFQIEPDTVFPEDVIEGLQRRLGGRKAEGKFYSRAPTVDDLRQQVRTAKYPDVTIGGRELTFEQARELSRAEKLSDDRFLVFDTRTEKGFEGIFPTAKEAETFIKASKNKFLDYGTPREIEEMNPTGEQSEEFMLQRLKEISALPVEKQRDSRAPPTLDDLRAGVRAAKRGSAEAGAAYTGFVRDQVEGVAAPTGKPLRREDILRPLLKALDVPLYQGRIKSKKFLGFYRRHVEEVRIKKMSDIEVASHELAHLLDDRFPELRRQWNPATKGNKAVREELRGVSYDKSKLFEGFAEFVRLWSTQREEAQARAPKFHGWFEDFVARNKHGPALRKAQGEMHAYFAQDAVSRARSKVGKVKEITAGLTRPFDRFRQAVSDDLHGIYRMERELTGGIAPVGAYETARLTRAKHSMIEGTLLYGAPVVKPDGSHAFEGKGLTQILDPVAGQLDDFLMYAVGRSAKELMGQGREHLFTPAEIKGMVALETPEFRRAFEEYQTWNRAILDFAQAKGIINPAARAMWQRTLYLPFHRVGQPGNFAAMPGDWKGIKALTGGTDNLRDILGNMIGNASMLIDAGLTNEARLEVARLAQQRGGARFLAKIPTDERRVRVHREEIKRAILEALGVKQKAQLSIKQQVFIDRVVNGMGAFVPLIQRGQAPYGGNVVAVLRKGKPEYYEVADPLLYASLTHLNRPTKNWLIRLLSVPKRIGQSSITLSLDFLAANIARDTLMGAVMSRHGFKPIVDSAKGMASRITRDQSYRDFIANGGGFASYLVDESAFKTHLEKFYGRKGIDYRTVLDTPSKLLLGLERIADSFEVATRIGEFKRATKAGAHPRHAAYSAREVSTDFAMRGDSAALGFAYDTIIFLKAAVAGMDRLYRGLAHDPNRAAIAAKSGLIALASMGLYALNRGNPDFDDLEAWDRDTHWHIFVPRPKTLEAWRNGLPLPPEKERYLHFRYPKIWEIGALASLAERSLERFLDEQPEKVAEDTWRILRDVFRLEYIPQAFAPLYEVAINRIRFIDRPIETEAMKDLQPWARSSPGGSRTLRALGEAERKLPTGLQLSPAKLEALLRGYLNTWAMYGLTLSDAAFFDDVPSLRVDQYPVLRRFYRQTPSRHTKYVTQLYDALAEATAARRTMRHMDRTSRPDFAAELEHTRENLEFNQLTAANKRMRALSAEMRRVVDAPGLPALQEYAADVARDRRLRPRITKLRRSRAWRDLGDLKRELLDLWTEERNRLAKDVMLDIETQRKGARP